MRISSQRRLIQNKNLAKNTESIIITKGNQNEGGTEQQIQSEGRQTRKKKTEWNWKGRRRRGKQRRKKGSIVLPLLMLIKGIVMGNVVGENMIVVRAQANVRFHRWKSQKIHSTYSEKIYSIDFAPLCTLCNFAHIQQWIPTYWLWYECYTL